MWRKCLDSNMAKDYVVQCRVMWVFRANPDDEAH